MFHQFHSWKRNYTALKGVSPKTVISYGCAFKAFAGATETKSAIMQRIADLRGKGISPISVNCYLRHLKAYLRWMEEEGHFKSNRQGASFIKTGREGRYFRTQLRTHQAPPWNSKPCGINQAKTPCRSHSFMLDCGAPNQ